MITFCFIFKYTFITMVISIVLILVFVANTKGANIVTFLYNILILIFIIKIFDCINYIKIINYNCNMEYLNILTEAKNELTTHVMIT